MSGKGARNPNRQRWHEDEDSSSHGGHLHHHIKEVHEVPHGQHHNEIPAHLHHLVPPPPGFEPPPERVAVDASGRATAGGGAGAVPLEVGLDAAAPSGEDVVSMDDDDDDDASEWRRFDDEDEDE